ncbi:ADP-dependent NAD(P)H-hydrate dehydratase [Microbacterium xanthum]|uniref:ADP-dependent NAD(P)H-hydrate dehydratase n=1 Tax=Microbacterium xanthum TaxID=3079794 RepID=UPI002AD260B4|nr:ADP/ATP-dependent (S)-NAD(P)H-hydrate dehydratase [Microbacterium sp. KSW-48]MDZ8171117.1 ADP/ATP-dependent (S)-NAD(P)H-hydrate dehydratase [Microbacterium sp. KSW-48]
MRRWTATDAAGSLRAPAAHDDKYTRGVVGVRTGSVDFPGAAVLGVEAAWRTGVGMVRYVGPARAEVLARRPETVAAAGRVNAWVIGSGTDATRRDAAETAALRELLDGDVPVVVDAGALDLVDHPAAPVVVTPHAGEFARLRDRLGLADLPPDADHADRDDAALETAERLGAAVLLKGARSVAAAPGGFIAVIADSTPWLATAGTGDVLAGVIGAVAAGSDALASAGDWGPVAATGAWLHGRAANIASSRFGLAGGPITAGDVAEALPFAVGEIVATAPVRADGPRRTAP